MAAEAEKQRLTVASCGSARATELFTGSRMCMQETLVRIEDMETEATVTLEGGGITMAATEAAAQAAGAIRSTIGHIKTVPVNLSL
jgi:hypothetical protein